MTDVEFYKELKKYLSDLVTVDRPIITTEFYCNLQPGLVSYGGHFILSDNESIPIDIRTKSKSSNADFSDKVISFHRQSTNGGLYKWNRALFKIDERGQIQSEFTWDEVWEQEEKNSYNAQPDAIRQKWYWDEK